MIKVLGVLGWPVSHSLSPMMHNKAIEILDLNYQYLPFAVPPEKLESAIRGIRGLGISGVNLTIPHKERVIPFLDSLSPEAEQAGAVNTVCLKGDKLLGHNTDGQGLIKSLKEEGIGDFKKKSVLLFGAGGASRGIAAALVSEGVHKIIISNRSTSKGEKLARLVKTFPNKCIVDTLPLPEISQKEMDSFDLLINTTSVGMKKTDPPLFDYNLISNKHMVCDIIYSPAKTELLQAAKAIGATSVNGLGMLLYQGALSFELWTGCTMPVPPVKELLLSILQKNNHG